MQAARDDNGLLLTFHAVENRILQRTLHSLIENYQARPSELDSKIAAVWYSTRGCERSGMSPGEQAEWIEQLRLLKIGSLPLLKRWSRLLAEQRGTAQLSLSLEEASGFLTVLNDHRLLLASRFDIGEDEMSLTSWKAVHQLNATQQAALYEIHLLACVMEAILKLLPGSPGDWG